MKWFTEFGHLNRGDNGGLPPNESESSRAADGSSLRPDSTASFHLRQLPLTAQQSPKAMTSRSRQAAYLMVRLST